MIEVKNISKTYGKKHNRFKALKNVSFKIPSGKSVAIVGKSGSGKWARRSRGRQCIY